MVSVFVYLYGESKISARGGSVYGKMGGRKREAVYMARWVGERERRRSLVSLFSRKNFLPLLEFVSHII